MEFCYSGFSWLRARASFLSYFLLSVRKLYEVLYEENVTAHQILYFNRIRLNVDIIIFHLTTNFIFDVSLSRINKIK